MGLLASILAFQVMDRTHATLLRNCAIIQAFPALALMIHEVMQSGGTIGSIGSYAMNFLFFGTVAAWTALRQSSPANLDTSRADPDVELSLHHATSLDRPPELQR
jgi:hypothetical protein